MPAQFRRFAVLLPILLVIAALGVFVIASQLNNNAASPTIAGYSQLALNANAPAASGYNYSARQAAPNAYSGPAIESATSDAYSGDANKSAQVAPLGAAMPTPANSTHIDYMAAATPAQAIGEAQAGTSATANGMVTAPGSEPIWPQPVPPVQRIEPNPFVRTGEDHLSTFALDVDTGSYGAARNYINAGTLPPPDTVRVEEFVNYFRYDYSVPEGDTFGIFVDSAPSPLNAGKTQIVRVGIQGQRIDNSQRKDAVLTFVIDVSGSMAEPNRLPLVKQALRLLVNELRDTDQVAIIVYGDEARMVLDHTSANSRDSILQAIDSLQNQGSTNAEAGLRMGYGLASKHYKEGAINRVILCSDGVANVGATSPEAIRRSIQEYTKQGIVLTTVGFGMGDYNDELMEQLADDGNGNYAYVDSLSEAQRIFVENLTGTLQVIAKDAKVQVDFNPAIVSSYRLVGYENRNVADIDFRNDKVDAGEIGAGHSVTALYEVELVSDNKSANSANSPALTVQLRYADPTSGQVVEKRKPLNQADFGSDFTKATARFQLAVAVAGFAESLRDGSYGSNSTLTDVLAIMQRIAPRLIKDKDVQEFSQLVQRAAEIRN